ncbi:MAG: protein kinase [Planctomycetes bacterium]|nr:protein kinase [Planctomycetota bacterium]
MQTVTCPTRDELTQFATGKSSPDPMQQIGEHLNSCESCRAMIDTIGDGGDTLASALRRPTPQDPYQYESALDRAASLIRAIGHESSFASGQDSFPALADLGQIGPYQFVEKLGEGGMGAVYKAMHTKLKRIVAIKVLSVERMRDVKAIARFEREMEAVGALHHPNIVSAHDAGEASGIHYLVMEYVAGLDLSKLIRRMGPLGFADACEIVRQAAVGLQHAHECGMVHRDIKPSNLMLASRDAQPSVKILDLGLALLDEQQHQGKDLTNTGQMMGTLAYMAPEQGGDSHEVDIRADIYSLGATLYKLLCGETPFPRRKYDTPVKMMMALANETPSSIGEKRPELPNELVELIDRMISRDPETRPSTPQEVAEALTLFANTSDLGALLDLALAEPAAPETGSSAETNDFKSSDSVAAVPTKPHADTPLREPSTQVKSKGNKPPRWPMMVAASLGMIGLFAAIILLLPSKYGTVRIEITDPSIEVAVSGEDRYRIQGKHGEFEIEPGEHTLKITAGGTTFQTKEFTVGKGEQVDLRVTLLEGAKVQVARGGTPFDEHQLAATPVQSKTDKLDTEARQWQVLFDGTSVDAWQGLEDEAIPDEWQIVDQELVGSGGKQHIMTRRKFGEFDLEFEWLVQDGTDGGVIYHAGEDVETVFGGRVPRPALEYQLSNGSDSGVLQDLYPVMSLQAYPVGEWNSSRIVSRGKRIEHWLNDVQVVVCDIGSDNWMARVSTDPVKHSYLHDVKRPARIALQTWSGTIRFRNIRIREWDSDTSDSVPASSHSRLQSDLDRTIAERVLKLGGIVGLEYVDAYGRIHRVTCDSFSKLPTEPYKLWSIRSESVTDDDLAGIERLRWIVSIDLTRNARFTDMTLKRIGKLNLTGRLSLNDTNVTDAGLAHLRNLSSLNDLNLGSTSITDVTLEWIGKQSLIGSVVLSETNVTDAGLAHLRNLSHLRWLFLNGTPITDDGLRHLAHLSNLQNLSVSETEISAAGLDHLNGLANLKSLVLEGTQIQPTDFQNLSRIPSLEYVEIDASMFTDDSAKALAQLPNLDRLEIKHGKLAESQDVELLTNISSLIIGYTANSSDSLLIHLKSLSNLRELRLQGHQNLTDGALTPLAEMKHLKELELTGSLKLTRDGILRLKAALPQCDIISDFGTFEAAQTPSETTGASATSNSDLNHGLVAHWNFEEGQGTGVADSSENGNHAARS